MIKKCPACGKYRPEHEEGCEHWKLLNLAFDMWYSMYKCKQSCRDKAIMDFQNRLSDFVGYPGSSHFPSVCSSSSKAI